MIESESDRLRGAANSTIAQLADWGSCVGIAGISGRSHLTGKKPRPRVVSSRPTHGGEQVQLNGRRNFLAATDGVYVRTAVVQAKRAASRSLFGVRRADTAGPIPGSERCVPCVSSPRTS